MIPIPVPNAPNTSPSAEVTTATRPRSTGPWRCRRVSVMRRSLGEEPSVGSDMDGFWWCWIWVLMVYDRVGWFFEIGFSLPWLDLLRFHIGSTWTKFCETKVLCKVQTAIYFLWMLRWTRFLSLDFVLSFERSDGVCLGFCNIHWSLSCFFFGFFSGLYRGLRTFHLFFFVFEWFFRPLKTNDLGTHVLLR